MVCVCYTQILSERFVPLVEQQQLKMTEELRMVEVRGTLSHAADPSLSESLPIQRSLGLMLASQKAQFLSLFQYSQAAAHIWDSHLASLEQLRQTHNERLRALRGQHDAENQCNEASLDIVLDRLRQASCPEVRLKFPTRGSLCPFMEHGINSVLYINED